VNGVGLKFAAFLKRDLLTARTYRFSFLLQIFNIGSALWMYFFLSRVVGVGQVSEISSYGTGFFAFLLVGVAFWNLLFTASLGAVNAIRSEQRSGTLEALLTTATPAWLIVLGGIFMPMILAAVELLLYLLFGALFFQVDLSRANWPLALALLLMSMLQGAAIGLLIASVIVLVKRAEAVAGVVLSLLGLLVGVFYPVEMLPSALQTLANVIPLTHALRAMRQALFLSATIETLWIVVVVLATSTVGIFFVGVWTLNQALNAARSEGTLAQF